MKLRTALTQYPFSTLCQLARDVGIDPGGSNKTFLADELCRLLPDPERIAKRLSALSPEQRAMVQTLAAEGGDLLETEAVEKFANGFLPRLHAQLSDLTGLVFRDVHTLGDSDVLIGIPESLLKSIPISDADQGRLLVILKPISVGLLRAFADQIGLNLSDTRKPIVSNAIRDALLDIKTLRTYLDDTLSEDRRAILDLFLPANAITRSEIADNLGESAVRELEDMLWKMPIFYAPNRNLHAPDAAICLASDLCAALSKIAQSQGGQLESSLDTLLETSTTPTAIRENTAFLIRDLTTLLGIITQRLPRRLKHGGISKTDLRDTNKYCHIQDDPGYIEFLTLFAETTGLIKPHDTVWHTASDAGTRTGQIIDIRKACFEFWFHSKRWNEWSSDRTKATSARMQVLKNIRGEIVQSLRHCPTGTWMTYPSYYQFLTRLSEPFRHFAKDPSYTGTTADELLRRTITGALTWMGVVRVGNFPNFSTPLQHSKQAVFQITPAGYALLHDMHDDALTKQIPLQNSEAKFVVQPNFEVLSPPDLPCEHYLKLCVFGDLKTQDVMACFHLSRDSLRRAFARGLSGDEIRAFLAQHSASGLPHMVETLIAECDDKYGEIEIHPATGRVKTATRELLDELYAQPRIAQALDDRISPTIAALNNEANSESLIQILQQQGYLPHLSRE